MDNPGDDICPICLPGPMILDSIKKVELSNEITIVGLGSRNQTDTSLSKRKLHYAKMNRITEKQCWKDWYPKNFRSEYFFRIANRGFCVKGSKKEVVGCTGDSGSPAFWKHQNKKEYLIGIFYESQEHCGIISNNSVKASKYVAIPGVIFKWIKEMGEIEIENWLKKC